MNRLNFNTSFFYFITLLLVLFVSSCGETSMNGAIVFTQVKGDLSKSNIIEVNSRNYFSESSIAVIKPKSGNESVKVLTEDFYAACAPKISFDGGQMLFSAQKNENDRWHVWEMNLSDFKTKQLTFGENNCIDPAYLPNGNIVFSQYVSNNTTGGGYTLFTSDFEGSNVKQITFNPHSYFASNVLKDGRLLAISQPYFPEEQKETLLVFRPDGTKQELFYKSEYSKGLRSGGLETSNGEVFITEFDTSSNSGKIVTVNYSNPLNTRVEVSSKIEGEFRSVYPINATEFIATYKSSANGNFGIYEFNIGEETTEKTIYQSDEFNIIEAVVVESKKLPRKLPSEINLNLNTALLVCQDASFTEIEFFNSDSILTAKRIEIIGIEESYGTVELEKDGSFYLKLLSDTPFRIQTIDESGTVINGPGSWLYLRPNERRGCVGCHENNEQVPDNKQPLSVRKAPFVLPSQTAEINKNEAVK